jgi:hypothetical protein
MRSNIVLIDYQNVQPDSLQLLAPEQFRVLCFIGANQPKVPVKIAAAMQPLGVRAEYVQIARDGRNALDFHIAYYIGVLAASDPSAYFHIVSRDTGFDPLIEHLRGKSILADRVEAIREIPIVKAAASKSAVSKSLEERIQSYADKLAHPKFTKPGTREALRNSIAAFFHKELTDKEVTAILAGLERRGFISIVGEKIKYAANQ